MPVSRSMSTKTMPSGVVNGVLWWPARARIMNWVQIGSAAWLPLRPSAWLSSRPTQTTVRSSGVKPWFISRVEDNKGQTLYAARPETAGVDAERVLDERNAFLMTTLMRDVVRYGTAAAAMRLGRNDLAGKTGTTNDHIDAWFCGFNAGLVGVAWIGFDTPANLGPNETGSQAALPIWMGYAGKVLKGVP